MAFILPNLTEHDIQFLIGDDLGIDHLPIEISIDAQPHRNTYTNPFRYKFDQTDREVFESTLEVALSSGDIPDRKSTQDIDEYILTLSSLLSALKWIKPFGHPKAGALKVNLFQMKHFS